MEKVENLRETIENTFATFKNNLIDILSEISESKNLLDEKHIVVDQKIQELRDKDKELEQFRRVSFIGAMSKQLKEKNNEISVLNKKIAHFKKELNKIKNRIPTESSDEEELDVYEEEINGKTYYITDGEKNYIYEKLKNGEIGDTKLGEISGEKINWL